MVNNQIPEGGPWAGVSRHTSTYAKAASDRRNTAVGEAEL